MTKEEKLELANIIAKAVVEAVKETSSAQNNEEKLELANEKAKAVVESLMETSSGKNIDNMPCAELSSDDFADGEISVIDVLVKAKLCPSKGDAKRVVQQGGAVVNDVKIDNIGAKIARSDFDKDGYVIVKKGKKSFVKVIVK